MTTYTTTIEPINYREIRRTVSGSYGSKFQVPFQDLVENVDRTTTLAVGSRREVAKDPDWKSKVAKRQNASNPYFVRRGKLLPGAGYLDIEYDGPNADIRYGTSRFIWHGLDPTSYLNKVDDPALADIALARLKRKLQNRTQSYNVLVPLGELRELRQTIEGAATFTLKTVEALRDVKKLRLKEAYKKASDVWLSYSFGMSPMMGTIKDISKSIGAYLTRYDSIDRLTGTATRDWYSRGLSTNITSCYSTSLEARETAVHKLQYKYIAGHRFSLTSANDYSAFDHFGISPPSLIPVIWELTAFSWVVDYFTTAGAFLDDTFSGQTGNSIYVVKNRKYTVQSSTHFTWAKTLPATSYRKFVSKYWPSKLEYYEFSREVSSTLPGRVLRFRTLDEMGLNGVNKLLNLTSVLSKSLR